MNWKTNLSDFFGGIGIFGGFSVQTSPLLTALASPLQSGEGRENRRFGRGEVWASTGRTITTILSLGLLLTLLAACAEQPAPADPDTDTISAPVEAVERYLQAKVEADADTISALLCSEMQSFANREANSFVTVTEVQITNMQCEHNSGADTVTCTGEILADYDGETVTFDLTTYRVVQESGEWKWCGEADS